MRSIIANYLLIALASVFLIHFCLITIYGNIVIEEPNQLMLWFEIAVMIALIVFGIFNILRK